MKRSLMILLVGLLIFMPVTSFADEADQEARIAALEEKVEALEKERDTLYEVIAQIWAVGEKKGLWGDIKEEFAALKANQSTSSESESASAPATDLSFEYNDCALQYDTFEVTKDYQGNNVLVVYFYFTNNSEANQMAMGTFNVQVFQNGKECGMAVISQSIPEYNDSIAQIMPGADPVRVAFLAKLADMSDVIVRVSPLISLGNDYINIPLKLQ